MASKLSKPIVVLLIGTAICYFAAALILLLGTPMNRFQSNWCILDALAGSIATTGAVINYRQMKRAN